MRFAEHCFWCYYLIRILNLTNKCEICHTDQFICKNSNYIIHFTGQGKYNNHYMCLSCLEKHFD